MAEASFSYMIYKESSKKYHSAAVMCRVSKRTHLLYCVALRSRYNNTRTLRHNRKTNLSDSLV